jgi:hypothetical protein
MTQMVTQTAAELTVTDLKTDFKKDSPASSSWADWAQSHWRKLLLAGVVILGALGVRAGLQSFEATKNKNANSALFEARKKASGYETVAETWPGTRAAFEALMALGDIEAQKDPKSSKAATWYEKADAQTSDPREKLLARYSAAYAREKEGKLELALSQVESAQKLGLTHLKGELALQRARLLDLLGNKEEATKAFDAIGQDFAGTETARTAEGWKASR